MRLCGTKGPLHKVGRQRCSGARRDKCLLKSLEPKATPQLGDDQSRGHLRMLSGQVIWCDRCGACGNHRGCGLAQPCPGHAIMGSGGGKWQRLLLLRSGRHPKDKQWIGLPVLEVAWSCTAASDVNTSLQEVRGRDSIVNMKVAARAAPSLCSESRLERVRQRVRQKEVLASNRVIRQNRIAESSSSPSSTGLLVSKVSRFEALRQRIREKEIRAMGELLEDG